LDDSGNATVSVPEIDFNNMPLVAGYVFSSSYAEPGYVQLGNIIPSEGTFRFAAGAANANADYLLVTVDGSMRFLSGTLDSNGNATVSVPEIDFDNMPLVAGYVFSSSYAEPGYVQLGNIIPSEGTFRFAAGAANGNANYLLVAAEASGLPLNGTLDGNGDAIVTVPDIDFNDMPLVAGYVFSASYAEPGYVQLGNIIPSQGTFRFAAGATNADAQYLLAVASQ
jgi:hypothetical protein